MNLTLYEIGADIREILSDVIANGGEITDEQWGLLEAAQGALLPKSDSYGMVIREFESLQDVIYAEEKRLAERRKVVANTVTRMKERIYGVMKAIDQREIKGDLFTFRIQKNPPSVKVDFPQSLPAEFVETRIEYIPKKNELGKALQAGQEIKGAVLLQGEHLRIV